MNKPGYELNKGRTFTPPASASNWIDRFNDVLEKEEISRNKLTSDLVEDGFKYRDQFASANNQLNLSLDGFSVEQIGFLNTTQGKLIATNMLKMLLSEQATQPLEVPKFKTEAEPQQVWNIENESQETEPTNKLIPTEKPAPPKINTNTNQNTNQNEPNSIAMKLRGRLNSFKVQ